MDVFYVFSLSPALGLDRLRIPGHTEATLKPTILPMLPLVRELQAKLGPCGKCGCIEI